MSISVVLTVGPYSAGRLWCLRLLCLTALLISGYLAWSAIRLQPVIGCSGSQLIDCEHVLNSHWSKVLGVPVSVPAVGLYSSLLGLLAFAGRPAPHEFQRLLSLVLSAGFLTAGWAALWFIGLQVLVLQHLCPWCLAAHACGLSLAVLALTWGSRAAGLLPVMSAGLGLAGALAAVQWLSPVPATFEVVVPDYARSSEAQQPGAESAEEFAPPASEQFAPPAAEEFAPPAAEQFEPPAARNLSVPSAGRLFAHAGVAAAVRPSVAALIQVLPVFSGDESAGSAGSEKVESAEKRKVTILGTAKPIELDPAAWPLLGSVDAKFIFVEMFDYTCPHCRETNRAVRGAFERFGSELAVIALPVPLEDKCNKAASGSGHAGSCELSRLAVAVWRCDRGKFREYHDWLFDKSRTVTAARRQAEDLVGRDRLRAEMNSGTPGKYIERHVDLYLKVGSGVVPKLLFSGSSVIGSVQKDALCSMIDRQMGQTPAK